MTTFLVFFAKWQIPLSSLNLNLPVKSGKLCQPYEIDKKHTKTPSVNSEGG